MNSLPAVATAIALTGLQGMTPARLRLLLRRNEPGTALAVVRGEHSDPVLTEHLRTRGRRDERPTDWFARWRAELERCGVAERYDAFLASGMGVVCWGGPGYPECLLDDPDAPSVLFHRGDLSILDARRVGIVGTRSATAGGLRLATDLGRELAGHGIRVVSGLARGIDGAAHRGALAGQAGRPVAVVASGLDVVYPREHRALWEQVATEGLLLGERPPGASPQAMSFPERNRILAGLCEIVVVVESRSSGGSLITAREALRRDLTVMAVPGSLSSRASEGTNELLRDGLATMLLDTTDVLVALGLDTRRASGRRFDPRPPAAPDEQHLLDLIGADAVTIDELVLRSGLPLTDVAVCLGRLESAGRVERSGGWFVLR